MAFLHRECRNRGQGVPSDRRTRSRRGRGEKSVADVTAGIPTSRLSFFPSCASRDFFWNHDWRIGHADGV